MDVNKKDFDAVVAYLSRYIKKHGPLTSVKEAYIAQCKLVKRQESSKTFSTFKGRFELKKYSMEEFQLMLAAQKQEVYELR